MVKMWVQKLVLIFGGFLRWSGRHHAANADDGFLFSKVRVREKRVGKI